MKTKTLLAAFMVMLFAISVFAQDDHRDDHKNDIHKPYHKPYHKPIHHRRHYKKKVVVRHDDHPVVDHHDGQR